MRGHKLFPLQTPAKIARAVLVLMLLCADCASGRASAAERYVDNSGSPQCSDSPAGGRDAQPWCTINYAARRAAPGDIVFIKTGIYREDLYIDRKNGGAKYITFQNYPGHSPVISGNGIDSGRNKIINSSFIRVIGITITNFQQGLFVETSNNVVLEKLVVHNIGQEGIHVKTNSGFVTLQDSIVHDVGKGPYNGEGVYIGTSSSQQPESPPYDNTHDVLLKGNKIYKAKEECIEAKEGTYNVTIDGNEMWECLLSSSITNPNWGAIELMEHRRYYNANPNHIIKNNIIRTAKTGIGLHTGAAVFNNVIYGQAGSYRGISIDNPDSDNYPRLIYHNTIDLPSSRAVVSASATAADVRNNIGPSSASNIAVQQGFFVNQAAGDYHLVRGSAPIGLGVSLGGAVPADIQGVSRSNAAASDLGAYEFDAGP